MRAIPQVGISACYTTRGEYVLDAAPAIAETRRAVLFVLIGLQVILFSFSTSIMLACASVILITLAARLLSVGAPVALFNRSFRLPPRSWQLLTWGGLRGGISVALALSLPATPARELLLPLTYSVVVFSILGQGLTFGSLVRRTLQPR